MKRIFERVWLSLAAPCSVRALKWWHWLIVAPVLALVTLCVLVFYAVALPFAFVAGVLSAMATDDSPTPARRRK